MDNILAPASSTPWQLASTWKCSVGADTAECPHCESANVTRLEGKAHRDGLLQCNRMSPAIHRYGWHRVRALKGRAQQVAAVQSPARVVQEGHQRASNPPYARRHLQNRLVHVPPLPRGHEGRRRAPWRAKARRSRPMRLSSAARHRNRAFRKPAPKKMVDDAGRARRSRPLASTLPMFTRNTLRGALVPACRSQIAPYDGRCHGLHVASARSSPGHGPVIHTGQRIRHHGDMHSNTAENFFSIFKRGVIGIYHHLERGASAPLSRGVRFPLQRLRTSATVSALTLPSRASPASA